MPETVESEEIHLFDGLRGRPAIMRHAIGGDEDSGAVVAETAVHEYFFVRIAEERKKLRDLIIGRWRPAADGNIQEMESGGFGLFPFPSELVGIFSAKIDDGGDAERFQLPKSFGLRLCAAEEGIVNFSCVGEAGEFQFLAEGNGADGRGRIILGLRKELRKREKREKQERAKKKTVHRRLDAKSLAGAREREKRRSGRVCGKKTDHYM